MATKPTKPTVKKYKRRYPTNLTLDEVTNIIEEAIDQYTSNNSSLDYSYMLARKGLYSSKLEHWEHNHEEVAELMKVLRGIAMPKLRSALMNGEGSTTGVIFNLKCNHGWIEEDKRQTLENNNSSIDMGSDVTIRIGYDEDESTD